MYKKFSSTHKRTLEQLSSSSEYIPTDESSETEEEIVELPQKRSRISQKQPVSSESEEGSESSETFIQQNSSAIGTTTESAERDEIQRQDDQHQPHYDELMAALEEEKKYFESNKVIRYLKTQKEFLNEKSNSKEIINKLMALLKKIYAINGKELTPRGLATLIGFSGIRELDRARNDRYQRKKETESTEISYQCFFHLYKFLIQHAAEIKKKSSESWNEIQGSVKNFFELLTGLQILDNEVTRQTKNERPPKLKGLSYTLDQLATTQKSYAEISRTTFKQGTDLLQNILNFKSQLVAFDIAIKNLQTGHTQKQTMRDGIEKILLPMFRLLVMYIKRNQQLFSEKGGELTGEEISKILSLPKSTTDDYVTGNGKRENSRISFHNALKLLLFLLQHAEGLSKCPKVGKDICKNADDFIQYIYSIILQTKNVTPESLKFRMHLPEVPAPQFKFQDLISPQSFTMPNQIATDHDFSTGRQPEEPEEERYDDLTENSEPQFLSL